MTAEVSKLDAYFYTFQLGDAPLATVAHADIARRLWERDYDRQIRKDPAGPVAKESEAAMEERKKKVVKIMEDHPQGLTEEQYEAIDLSSKDEVLEIQLDQPVVVPNRNQREWANIQYQITGRNPSAEEVSMDNDRAKRLLMQVSNTFNSHQCFPLS